MCAEITKDCAFSGLEDLVDEPLKDFARELTRRLERYSNSMFYQIQAMPTTYTNAEDNPPQGMKQGDVWVNVSGGVRRYSGLAWENI